MELAQESAVVKCGVVDVDKGVVYKVAASRKAQVWSAWRLLAWLILGFVIPVALTWGGRVLKLDGWPL
jgi:hypothetical protein